MKNKPVNVVDNGDVRVDPALHRNFALEAVRVTEAAAVASYEWRGKGDDKSADRAAVNAMRSALNMLSIDGTVVIGEGERDKAPMLYIGERVGAGEGPELDIALDPLEGTSLCAHARPNAMAVIAFAEKGGFLHAPDVYMQKIAVGGGLPDGVVSLEKTPAENLASLAEARGRKIGDLTVCILERSRHEGIIESVRQAGARVKLIQDGDVSAVIATTDPDATGVDMYLGTGGAPEGVLAAAALRCTGGQMQGRLLFSDDESRERAGRMGVTDPDKIYTLDELAYGNVMFAATGVTDGDMLDGVRFDRDKLYTQSIVMRSSTGTVRTVTAAHGAGRKLPF